MAYNGYANQNEFHKALRARFAAYAVERERKMIENPEGMRHEGCSHADGICSAGGY